ncbi:ATP-dependent DNA ligase [Streptomyces sp. NRRL B-1568]|nr:ATP-dependent DNA ligase [Streptomyces sp. NRRL B-1568]
MPDLPLIAPMLATPGTLPHPREDHRWAYETKLDGQRCVSYLPGDGTLRLRARSGEDITAAYPELRGLATALGSTSAVLDGEIVALDERGHSDFELLQQRMGLAGSPAKAARMAAEVPTQLMLFDVMLLGGEALLDRPYEERRATLESLGLRGPGWSTPAAIVGHGEAALAATRERGLEGVVCKRTDSRYAPGVRSRAWVKIRNIRTIDVIIGGWLPGKGRLSGLPGAVLVGVPDEGALRFVGAVGTGWTDRERQTLAELLSVAETPHCPFAERPPVAGARWAVPRLVGEVRYSTLTRAGYLRQPSWHRLRPDLAREDLTRDSTREGL